MKQENEKPSLPEQSFYQTGNTNHKRRHRGIFITLIVTVILLIGAVSVMSIMNIQLFRRVLELDSDPDVFAFRSAHALASDTTAGTEHPRKTTEDVPRLELHQTPPAIANIPQQGGLSLQDIYQQTADGVVTVTADGGNGSGVVISDCGFLLTDRQLLGNSQSANILFHDGTVMTARLVGEDPLSDLAVLDLDASGLTPVTFADDSLVQPGDPVVAIGNPMGAALPGTITDGIVSAINWDLQVDSRRISLLQTNAILNNGNSGGPIFNCYGQVIGIHTAGLNDRMNTTNTEELHLAISSSSVKEIVDALLRQGYVPDRASLGFEVEQVSAFDQLYYKVPAGLFIIPSDQDSPFKPGDILLSFAGHRVGDPETLQAHLDRYRAGDTITLVIYREGTHHEFPLTLTKAQ